MDWHLRIVISYLNVCNEFVLAAIVAEVIAHPGLNRWTKNIN